MKLTNLGKFKFVGDLSLQDADVLVSYGKRSPNILEFGVGGSTQLLAQCKPKKLFSVETDQAWVNLTKSRLAKIEDKTDPVFLMYSEFSSATQTNKFDLIFVDGVFDLRKEFAIKTWDKLKDNGVMIFHDTRRSKDFQNAAWIAQLYFNEITRIDINAKASDSNSSNMTVLFKKPNEPYVNWNYAEDKPLWAYSKPGMDNPELWSQA